ELVEAGERAEIRGAPLFHGDREAFTARGRERRALDARRRRNAEALPGAERREIARVLVHEMVDGAEHEQRPRRAQHEIAVPRIEAERDEALPAAPSRDEDRAELARADDLVARVGRSEERRVGTGRRAGRWAEH